MAPHDLLTELPAKEAVEERVGGAEGLLDALEQLVQKLGAPRAREGGRGSDELGIA